MEQVKFLVIDNDEVSNNLVRETLLIDKRYVGVFKIDHTEALEALRQGGFNVVVNAIGEFDEEDAKFLKEARMIDPDCVIIGALDEKNSSVAEDASITGIYSVIHKPFDLHKLLFLINKGAELHAHLVGARKSYHGQREQNNALQKQNTLLAKRIEESTLNLTRLYQDLRATYMRTIKALAEAIDARDHYTHSHSMNVAKYAVVIAQEMHLSVKETELIREACELHDLGKIGIEDSILMKPSSLTAEEWELVKRHPITGAQILEPLTFLNGVIDLVRQHHEHYDGSGYPEGMKENDILLGARIIHLADSYDAMTSARSYRRDPLSKEAAVVEINKHSGTQFDPKVVDVFLQIVDRL
ncbi:MAG: HD domain-containing phosphohydrolase [Candidatus Omnitrophota bacterium]